MSKHSKKLVITLEILERHGACHEQQDLFFQIFPEGAELNRANLVKAAKAGLTVTWLPRYMLHSGTETENYFRAITPAREAYMTCPEEKDQEVWDAYQLEAANVLATILERRPA